MAFCSNCGTQVADGVAFCPNCGKATGPAATEPGPLVAPPSTGPSAAMPLEENIAGMLAYFTIIPAIIFLLVDPFNRNRFVRFHSFQCIFVAIAWIVIYAIVAIIATILHFIPVLGWMISMVLWWLLSLAGLVIWLLLIIKAFQHEIYKLPVVGDMAERQAGM